MPHRPQLAQLISRIDGDDFVHSNPDGTDKARARAMFPLWGTPKIDGRRCIKLGGRALTRSWKLQENEHVQTLVSNLPVDGLDGELIVPSTQFNDGESCFKRYDWAGDFQYLIFDYCAPGWEFMTHRERWTELLNHAALLPDWCTLVCPRELSTMTELLAFDEKCLEGGFEGACYRLPSGLYKSGRSTLNQQWLLKRKPFADADAVVIGFVPLMHNNNPPTTNELGLLKRGKRAEFMQADNTLFGALKVRDMRTNVEFEIGTGFDTATRSVDPVSLVGRVLTYKYQKHGMKDKPRCPVFRGFRYDI